jgi:hypothetical protein
LRQFTTGLMGWFSLWIFMSPLMVGAEGFIFIYLHLWSLEIKVLLCFTVFLIWDWKGVVVSDVFLWKLLSCRKFSIFSSYWSVGSMTMEFPLSARVSVALFSDSLVLIYLISFDSGCVLLEVFCCVSFWISFATNVRYICPSVRSSFLPSVTPQGTNRLLTKDFHENWYFRILLKFC